MSLSRADWAPPILLGAMVGAMVAGRFETAIGCVLTAAAAAGVAGARLPRASVFAALAVGVALALVLNLYLTPGRALSLPALFGRRATAEGLRHGALLGLRLVGAGVAMLGLRAAWPGERGVDEVTRLLRPLARLRVPVDHARVMVALALRFVPLLVSESRRIAAIQELRAGGPPRSAGEWLVRRRASLIPTLVGALERAERTALALEARHYRVRPVTLAPMSRAGGAVGAAIAGASLLWRS